MFMFMVVVVVVVVIRLGRRSDRLAGSRWERRVAACGHRRLSRGRHHGGLQHGLRGAGHRRRRRQPRQRGPLQREGAGGLALLP